MTNGEKLRLLEMKRQHLQERLVQEGEKLQGFYEQGLINDNVLESFGNAFDLLSHIAANESEYASLVIKQSMDDHFVRLKEKIEGLVGQSI